MLSRSLRPRTLHRVVLLPTTRTLTLHPRLASTHAHHDDTSSDVFPEEGFNAPFWRTGVLLVLSGLLLSRVLPSPSPSPPALDDDDNDEGALPFITRYISYNLTPQEGLWKARQERHLTLAKEAADDKLLFQEAERPKVRRMRYLGTFDQASPNGIPVGSQADLSNLKIKSEKDDFGFGKSEEGGEGEEEE